MSLLDTAKAIKIKNVRKEKAEWTEEKRERWELAAAWARGEVRLKQVAGALGVTEGNVYKVLSDILREYVISHK